MFDRLDDTIVAISSPAGVSARGIIRLSGPKAFTLAASVFNCDNQTPLDRAAGYKCIAGRVKIDEPHTLPAQAYTFRAPKSYTRQNVVEIHTIGSPPILTIILEQLTAQGARPAEAGEFTARAYFHGALDLTRVEGVAAIINARNDSQLRASEALLHGKLSRETTRLRDKLADLLALVEAEIDFVEEPVEFISQRQITETIDYVADAIQQLLQNATSIERLDVLPEILLAGPPNAGKSTLFNQLTGMDRAIQSATAGTTRDVISAPLTVPGREVMLLDSAGLGHPENPKSKIQKSHPAYLAQTASRRSLASADMILLIVDIIENPEQTIQQLTTTLPNSPTVVVANKIDKLPENQLPQIIAKLEKRQPIIAVSALTGQGMEQLRDQISKKLFSGAAPHGTDLLALSNRHRTALGDAYETLVNAKAICDAQTIPDDNIELLALHVRDAMNHLSMMVGEVTTDDLLGRIFSSFCIGK